LNIDQRESESESLFPLLLRRRFRVIPTRRVSTAVTSAVSRELSSVLSAVGSENLPGAVAHGDAVTLRRLERAVELLVRCDDGACVALAQRIADAFAARFAASSVRAARLCGLVLEAQAQFDAALALYERVALAHAPSVTAAALVGRQAAVLRHVKQFGACVALLNSQLAVLPCDVAAWRALLGVTLELHHWAHARHCVEQLLVLQTPQSDFALAILYADLLATLGDVPLAKQYYVVALDLAPASPRAAYGLHYCLSVLPKRSAADDTLLRFVTRTIAKQLHGKSALTLYATA
jgi:tetratricopeptide (TPR) repeat protein